MRGTPVTDSPLNQALQSTLAVLTKVGPDDMESPTPCASWDVRALVNHLVGTPRWWAAVVSGQDLAADADYAAGDFVAAYEESGRLAVAAFAAEGALDKTVQLPFGEFSGAVLRDLAATEQFIHGWDVARATAIFRRPGSRVGGLAARPGQARDHRRVPRPRRPGPVRARG